MRERYIGIDIGAETIKLVELSLEGRECSWNRRAFIEHHKEPEAKLLQALDEWDWSGVTGAATTGRLSRQVKLPRIPTKQALANGFQYFFGDEPATVVSIGSHGFAVLEIRSSDNRIFRENIRCSQGTGNFLRQLVERFELGVEEASCLATAVERSVPLSSRCPVILKTDITHLANKGEERAHILAGLFDAICENVQVLIKPQSSPKRVALVGGVSRIPRIRARFDRFLGQNGMTLLPYDEEAAIFSEALGCALVAVEQDIQLPDLHDLFPSERQDQFEIIPALSEFLGQVKRMSSVPMTVADLSRQAVLGFDIGSTGSKAVVMDSQSRDLLWEGYVSTRGDPLGAARTLAHQFCDGPVSHHEVMAVGATGSGREIVGSLLATCYGTDRVFIFNEIAAHAQGALHYDARVDTIFEIGGQDAKYIRLEGGKVVEAAMNEACSAGTGSFIEEQGRRFSGIEDVIQLGQEALLADSGISLGQHCSVFMAEVIDEAVAAGIPQRSIIAGVYDSIIQNYLNRVKGNRSVGQVIFCQGMPFSADALAAAVARQTRSEVVVPPNPGNVGAFGIALLANRELDFSDGTGLDMHRFLTASVDKKDTFVCRSSQGCGGSGNHCRIERLTTTVERQRKKFTWGGACSLHDSGTTLRKLPDLAPDPFREKQELAQRLKQRVQERNRGAARIALTDEFLLKDLFPFFGTFFSELGYEVAVLSGADQDLLKRGTEQANVPYCAPMKLYHGLVAMMAEQRPDYLFLPMLRGLPRVEGAPNSNLCPIVQASSDLLQMDLKHSLQSRLISPVIDIGSGSLRSESFIESCQKLAVGLGVGRKKWKAAFESAMEAQTSFESRSLEIGRRALQFCSERDIVPVVIMGRPYTIYNGALNSNVPAILREQGVVPIPVDCYPVDAASEVHDSMYWAHGQRNIRAAHQIRRTKGVYSVWCSNYSCGPDGFLLHFYSYAMEGKPFAVIETDGHSGDAGTKTRMEAFLYCVKEDRISQGKEAEVNSLKVLEMDQRAFLEVRSQRELLLVPPMGCAAEPFAACLRGLGFRAESLPIPDREALALGRRHTSGKECLPMTVTLGSLLQRIQRDRETQEKFSFFMPTSNGPCRFGVYNLLDKIVLERLGVRDRVSVVSPHDADYFEGIPGGFSALVFIAFVSSELLQQAFFDVWPVQDRPDAAVNIYRSYREELLARLEAVPQGNLSLAYVLGQVANGKLCGISDLLERASRDFAAVRSKKEVPTVLVSGEIYNRLDVFSNDFLVDKLVERGIRVHLATLSEWLEYTDYLSFHQERPNTLGDYFSTFVRKRIHDRAYRVIAENLDWHDRVTVMQMLDAASPYLRRQLEAESVLTIGGPLCMWQHGSRQIDGVISVGPLECMPNKIAESMFYHLTEQTGLPSLTLALNGDPVDPEVLDTFVYELHSRLHDTENQRASWRVQRYGPSSMESGPETKGATDLGISRGRAESVQSEGGS